MDEQTQGKSPARGDAAPALPFSLERPALIGEGFAARVASWRSAGGHGAHLPQMALSLDPEPADPVPRLLNGSPGGGGTPPATHDPAHGPGAIFDLSFGSVPINPAKFR